MARALFAASVATLLLAGPTARATVVVDLPLPALAVQSAAVIHGVVEARRTEWEDGHRGITTRVTVRVVETWRGVVDGRVVVDQPGGEINGVGQHVEGAASFEPGEEVVLFLEPHRQRAGEYVLVNLAASKFSVRRDGTQLVAIRDVSGLSFAERGADGHLRPSSSPPLIQVPLDELRTTVKGR